MYMSGGWVVVGDVVWQVGPHVPLLLGLASVLRWCLLLLIRAPGPAVCLVVEAASDDDALGESATQGGSLGHLTPLSLGNDSVCW